MHELPELTELTPWKKAQCLKDAQIKKRIETFRECDDGGCNFDVPAVLELTLQQELECRRSQQLQQYLQQHGDEIRKRLREERESQTSQ